MGPSISAHAVQYLRMLPMNLRFVQTEFSENVTNGLQIDDWWKGTITTKKCNINSNKAHGIHGWNKYVPYEPQAHGGKKDLC
jgi:hypothetical protein